MGQLNKTQPSSQTLIFSWSKRKKNCLDKTRCLFLGQMQYIIPMFLYVFDMKSDVSWHNPSPCRLGGSSTCPGKHPHKMEMIIPIPWRIHGAAIYGNMDPISIPQMLAYIQYMDPMGISLLWKSPSCFPSWHVPPGSTARVLEAKRWAARCRRGSRRCPGAQPGLRYWTWVEGYIGI